MSRTIIVLTIAFMASACVHVKQTSEITNATVGDTLQLKNDAFIVKCNVHESTITMWLDSGAYKNDKCLLNKTSASFGHPIAGKIASPQTAKVVRIVEHAKLGNYTSYTFIKMTGSRTTYVVSDYNLKYLFSSEPDS